jgi:hypothetical protein
LADDAVFVTRRGTITGKKAIVDRLRSGPAAGMRGGPFIRRILARRWQRRAQQHGGGGMLSQVEFEPPTESGDVVTMKAKLPPNPMISSLTLTFTFDLHDRLMRIEQHVA